MRSTEASIIAGCAGEDSTTVRKRRFRGDMAIAGVFPMARQGVETTAAWDLCLALASLTPAGHSRRLRCTVKRGKQFVDFETFLNLMGQDSNSDRYSEYTSKELLAELPSRFTF